MFCSRFRFWPKNGLVIKTEEEAEVFIVEASEFGHQSSRKNEENRICIGPYQSTDIQLTLAIQDNYFFQTLLHHSYG